MTVLSEQKPTIDTLQDELNELGGRRQSLERSIFNIQCETRYHATDADKAQLDSIKSDRDEVLNKIAGITEQVVDLTAANEKERKSCIKREEKHQRQMAETLVEIARSAMAARSEIASMREQLFPELISVLEKFDVAVQSYRVRHSEFVDTAVSLGEADHGMMGIRAEPALAGMLERLNSEASITDPAEPMPSDGARRLLKVAEHLLQPKLYEQQQFGLNNR